MVGSGLIQLQDWMVINVDNSPNWSTAAGSLAHFDDGMEMLLNSYQQQMQMKILLLTLNNLGQNFFKCSNG